MSMSSGDSLVSAAARPGSSRDRSLMAVLQADWKSMLYHEESKDFKLVVGSNGDAIPVHSLVLTARCDRLRKIIDNKTKKLCFKHLEPAAVKTILHYLYSAELEVSNALDVVPLQMVAYEFGLSNLRSYFLQCLEYLLTQNNICKVLTLAHTLLANPELEEGLHQDLWCIVDTALQYVSRNVRSVMSSDVILDLDKQSLKLLVSSKLPISNQEIMKSILRWGRYQAGTAKVLQSDWSEEERKLVRAHIEEVIPHIHLADGRPLSPDSISDGVYGILERCSWAESCSSSMEERFPESSILHGRQDHTLPFSEWLGHSGQWFLLYRGTSHGFVARDFHSHCDNYGPTLTIIKSTSGHIFGGFTDVSWNCRNKRGKYSTSHHSFLFSIFNPSSPSASPVKYSIKQPSYAINSHPQYGPIFGSGADLFISSNCHLNEESYSRLPSSYGDDHTHPFALAGTVYFQVKDYEVFGQQT